MLNLESRNEGANHRCMMPTCCRHSAPVCQQRADTNLKMDPEMWVLYIQEIFMCKPQAPDTYTTRGVGDIQAATPPRGNRGAPYPATTLACNARHPSRAEKSTLKWLSRQDPRRPCLMRQPVRRAGSKSFNPTPSGAKSQAEQAGHSVRHPVTTLKPLRASPSGFASASARRR
jgi:hypothetical protein